MNESNRTWVGWLLLCALFATGHPQVANAQSRGPAADDLPALQVAHREAVRVERERALLETWMDASESQRETIERLVREGRDPRRSSLSPLSLRQISMALRSLNHPARGSELEPWFDRLDSLDLRVRPGVFAARSEGRGEPLTVTLESLWSSAYESDSATALPAFLHPSVRASLVWTSARGEEFVARSEPVTARALQRGFEMYIRPPVSEAQTWSLVLELQTDQGVIRSFPVLVECVPDLQASLSRLRTPAAVGDDLAITWNEPLRQRILTRFELLVRHGIRVGNGVPLAQCIASYDASGLKLDKREIPPGADVLAIDGAALGVPGETFWELRATRKSNGVLVLLADVRESPTDLLSGLRGAAWQALGQATGMRVIAGHLPFDAADLQPLTDFVGTLRTDSSIERVLVVGRGNSGRLLPRLLTQEVPGLDGLILSETIAAGAPFSPQLKVPALRVQFDAAAEDVGVRELGGESLRRTHVAISQPGPLAFPAALDAIQTWIESL